MTLTKREPIRSKKLRNAARGQRCTLNFPCCNYEPETTVLAHLRDETFGMSRKADDTSAVHACSECHRALDTGTTGLDAATLAEYLLRALQRTIRRLTFMQVIIVPQDMPARSKTSKRKTKGAIQSCGFQQPTHKFSNAKNRMVER